MPPFVSRKREHSLDLPRSSKKPAKRAKPTLFEAADAPSRNKKSAADVKKYLDSLDDSDSESLSDAESDEFEDVVPVKRQKTSPRIETAEEMDSHETDEDEMEWENIVAQPSASAAAPERIIADVSISMKNGEGYTEPIVSMGGGKRGPAKKERQQRILAHCMHVQYLLWHNTIRNSWLNDKEVQKTLVDGLPEGVRREVRRWKQAMGTLSKEELEARKKQAARSKKGGKGGKGEGKSKGRDWNYDAQHTEQGVPNLSHGDPLLRLLKVLTAYWRKRFTVTAPALRKQGYMPLGRLSHMVRSWSKNKDKNDHEEHGERIEDVQAFLKLAKACEGSRDVGAQLFVAMLRGLGLETRVVVNLQPVGFGWSKSEEANEMKLKKEVRVEDTADSGSDTLPTNSAKKISGDKKPSKKLKAEQPTRTSARGNKGDPISLDDSDSPLTEPPSSDESNTGGGDDDDDLSVIDITPAAQKKKPMKKYDRDLAFPTYWAEVCSPVSQKYIPVDPVVLSTIASNDDLLQTFEPRGKKAEISKQVICYVTAYATDGTAKDVTVRYLKRHQLPGKTKGIRLPTEKVPIYNRRGKVSKYENYDWFSTVMSVYERPHAKRTAADDLEEQTDLKPFKASGEKKEAEKESLQWYKQSAEFVLEQHLRREEAILPDAEPVKTFTAGKGDKTTDHPVYRRDDVVTCKTIESWHKEGRIVKTGEQPMKHVPVRAATVRRKREVEEAQRETGEKLKQGLYSWDQTEWIIPPPIENGVIPKNAYGNMDVYVESMVPKGAIHLPLKGSAKLCRKLQIDYAEACTGFEFGKQRAVPVITGVVVAEENAQIVRDAWRAEQKEIKRKEDTKRTAAALYWWRKMVAGLRIVERMKEEYGMDAGSAETVNPFLRKAKVEDQDTRQFEHDELNAGGFFPEGHDEEELPQNKKNPEVPETGENSAGGFMVDTDEDDEPGAFEGDANFIIEEVRDKPEETSTKEQAPVTPVSLEEIQADGRSDIPDDDEEMQDQEDDAQHAKTASAKRSARKTANLKARPKASVRGRGNAKSKPPPIPPHDSDASEDNLDDTASSPQILVSASKRRQSTRPRTRARKTTPVKSQYFGASGEQEEEEEEEEDPSSEEEVVRPTRTTARTRKKA